MIDLLVDSHTHSIYSFDGYAPVREMCLAAERAGVSRLVVTDHYDIDGVRDGFYADYDMEAARRDIDAAREEFGGRVALFRGIELGQGALRPQDVQRFLARGRFDFVIASCHNLGGVPDFSFLNYTEMPQTLIDDLYRRMLAELCLHAAIPGVDTVAHLTYPLRYMARCGRNVDLPSFTEEFRTLFSVMREHGCALELNMKAIWLGAESPETEMFLLRLFRACGGEEVTIGSDAHRPEEIGRGIADGCAMLREAGFADVLFPAEGGGRTHIRL